MIQLYVLSILCNGLAGYVLFIDNDSMNEKTKFFLSGPTLTLVLGILCTVTGVLKLISPIPNVSSMKAIIILGDLVPALSGIVAGLLLIFGIYRQSMSAKSGELDRLGVSLLAFRKPIGLGLIVVAIVHFIFADRILFL